MAHTVRVIAVLTAKAQRGPELEALLQTLIVPSRAEPGNLRYDLWRDASEPFRFIFDELYRDDAAAASHRATPHFQHYLAHIGELAERAAYVVAPFDVASA